MYLEDCLLGMYEKALPFSMNWEEKLGTVKKMGFDFMELSIDPAHVKRLDWSENEISELREVSLRLGVPLHTLALSANRGNPLGSKDSQVREEGKILLKKAICLAQKLGVRIVQIAAYDVYDEDSDEETDRNFLESLKECERVAALTGIMLALETMDTPYAGSVESCKRIVDIIDSPWLQIYADTGNIASAGLEFTDDIQTGPSNIVAIHLKDSRTGVVRDVDYGTGIVDFDKDLRGLKKIGYSGFFVAEMWWKDDSDYLTVVQQAHDFLREKIKKADLDI